MFFLNFLILFLQELRVFLNVHFESQSLFVMLAVLGFQFLLFSVDVCFHGFSMPKIALLMLFFVPLYVFNNFALHCVFLLMNIINVKFLSLRRLVRYVLIIRVVFIMLSFALLAFGIVHDEIWNMPKGSGHTLGFTNPNMTSSFLTNLFLIFSFYFVISKKTILLNFLLLIPIYAVYKMTCGRTYFIGACVYYLFLLLFRSCFFYRHHYWLYKLVPVLLGAMLVIGLRIYESFPLIDILFSRRLSMSKQVIDGFSRINYLLGSSYIPDGTTIDSSYLFLLCEAGIFSVGLFMLLYVKFVKKITFSEAQIFFPFIFYILVAGVSEITFPTFSTLTAIFYKILYQTATRGNRMEFCHV